MKAKALHTDAIVLEKRATAADGWEACSLFTAEHGPLLAMQRVKSKTGTPRSILDLFDEAALFLESSNEGHTWFVREARITLRQTGIGGSYAALQGAAAFTRMVARNPVGPDSRPAVHQLLRTGLAAFALGARPEIVLFKCLYCFARDEGYPIKQDWFPRLSAADRAMAALLLNRPLAEQTAAPEEVTRLQQGLADYLRQETEISV